MIARIWRGRVRTADADRYVQYVMDTGIADYQAVEGNLGVTILRNDGADGVTGIDTLTFWTSWSAIRAFAGEDPSVARYYPEDDAFLLERNHHVEHYEVPYSTLAGGEAR